MRANLANRQYRALVFRYLSHVQANRCTFCDCWLSRNPRSPYLATIDHWVPKVLGGRDDLGNLFLACLACNLRKGSADPRG